MQCLRCHAQNREGIRFCEDCGARLAAICPSCGAEVTAGKRFCGSCGTPLGASETRVTAPESYTPKHLAEKILTSKSAMEGERKVVLGEKQRIRMTVGCHDCDAIPKVADAGEVHDGPLGRYQVMHNGVRIAEHCYTGPWSTELIRTRLTSISRSRLRRTAAGDATASNARAEKTPTAKWPISLYSRASSGLSAP